MKLVFELSAQTKQNYESKRRNQIYSTLKSPRKSFHIYKKIAAGVVKDKEVHGAMAHDAVDKIAMAVTGGIPVVSMIKDARKVISSTSPKEVAKNIAITAFDSVLPGETMGAAARSAYKNAHQAVKMDAIEQRRRGIEKNSSISESIDVLINHVLSSI
jgi:hypothetical protein